jgi:hypothetical protein
MIICVHGKKFQRIEANMSLFNAKQFADDYRAGRPQNPDSEPRPGGISWPLARKNAEIKALRAERDMLRTALNKLGPQIKQLEARADAQEEFNAQTQNAVEAIDNARKTAAGESCAMCRLTGKPHSVECFRTLPGKEGKIIDDLPSPHRPG